MDFNTRKHIPILLSVAVAISISGCAEKRKCETTVPVKKIVKTKAFDMKDQQIHDLQVAIAEARSQKPRTVIKEVSVPSQGSLYPPNAKPGECYARVLIPAKYTLETEKVLAKEAGDKVEVIPAKYQMVDKKILVKEASEKIVTIPAKYKTVTEKIQVTEPSEKLITTAPVYKTETEKILVKAAHTAWKKGRGPIEKLSGETGEILCLVNVPAVYKTITKKILVKPAETKTVAIPARYKTITKRVLATPATTKTVTIPAIYKTIKVKEMVTPATVRKIPTPETYRTITKKVKINDAILKWQPVVCKTNMNGSLVRDLQSALKHQGFNPGPIDGIYGWRTRAAVQKFQKAKGISSGALTQETIKTLGL